MIKEVIKNWDERKHLVREWFSKGNGDSYEEIVEYLVEVILKDLEPEDYQPKNYKEVIVLDHGNYQGDMGFIIVPDEYQPSIKDYIITNQSYGSCSGCDLLQSINQYYEDGKPNEEQLSQLMMLALHLVQKMKYLGEADELDY